MAEESKHKTLKKIQLFLKVARLFLIVLYINSLIIIKIILIKFVV